MVQLLIILLVHNLIVPHLFEKLFTVLFKYVIIRYDYFINIRKYRNKSNNCLLKDKYCRSSSLTNLKLCTNKKSEAEMTKAHRSLFPLV